MDRVWAGMLLGLVLLTLACGSVFAVERFPPPDFESPYKLPSMPQPRPRSNWQDIVDVGVLFAALSVSAWLVLGKRNRRGITALVIFALVYFGFYRGGCVCPIGAIQNVTLAVADGRYALPFTVVLFFVLPLLFALLFGRVFCAGVCPLGAIQDVVLIKPLRVPIWLQRGLGVLPFVYLGTAVMFAATDTMFIICRYDPFVSFFRLSGEFHMLAAGGVVLLLSTFVGRPYCRFLCPYGALLGILSRFAWRRASITPDKCVVCSLCHEACPFGAIRAPTPEGVTSSP